MCWLSCNLPEPQGIFDALAPTTRYSGILMFVYNLDTIYCVFSLTGYHIYGIIQLFSGRGTAPETSRFSFPQSWLHGFIWADNMWSVKIIRFIVIPSFLTSFIPVGAGNSAPAVQANSLHAADGGQQMFPCSGHLANVCICWFSSAGRATDL